MNGIEIIAAERQRQVDEEGFGEVHDDGHTHGELRDAAIAYVLQCDLPDDTASVLQHWPWEESWWKPSEDPVRNLAKAGALIAAEIDRLKRAEEPEETDEEWATFTLGYLWKHANDWTAFCDDFGLNPYVMSDGIATENEKYSVPISVLRKHGVLPPITERGVEPMKRYDHEGNPMGGAMVEDSHGEYVLVDDVLEIIAWMDERKEEAWQSFMKMDDSDSDSLNPDFYNGLGVAYRMSAERLREALNEQKEAA